MIQQRPATVRKPRERLSSSVKHGRVRVVVARLTSEHAQDSSCSRDLGLRLFRARPDLDALEPQQGDDHGGESEKQRDDHQSATRLHVTCENRNLASSTENTHHAHRGATESRVSIAVRSEANRRRVSLSPRPHLNKAAQTLKLQPESSKTDKENRNGLFFQKCLYLTKIWWRLA